MRTLRERHQYRHRDTRAFGFHDEGEAHRETIFHAAERVISGRLFRPEIPAAGGRLSHCLEYGNDCRRMRIFREHGLSFTEPEIYRVFPVDERGQGGTGGLPRDPSKSGAKKGPTRVAPTPLGEPQNGISSPTTPAGTVSRRARRCRCHCRSRSPCPGTARARPAR